MAHISRRDIEMLLIGIDGHTGEPTQASIGGITRFQKLIFLLEREVGLMPTNDGFEFCAYKAGPYSSKIYDDLEFLENLGLIESEVSAEITEAEAAELDILTFDELMGDSADKNETGLKDGLGAPDAYEERRYRLTEKGSEHVKQLLSKGDYKPVVDGIRKIKSSYSNFSLSDLLYYVYAKYPEMTTESEIKDKILRRRKY